ncbi:hypothetical protein K438DRAFT_1969586 [Mycena galopus ATCC 62051]|nr:hypothetical protein K438DRAFT_1969586 [Mycena galopus ATCC 62051]
MISDPTNSLTVSSSPIASPSESEGDTSSSTGGSGSGDQLASATDSTSSSFPLRSSVMVPSSASSTVSQSTFTSASSGVAVIIPSSTIPAQVSFTIAAGSTMPTDSSSSTPTHHSRTGAIAGGIVGGIALLLLLLGFALWFFRRHARKQAGLIQPHPGSLGEREAGTGPELGADEKVNGVVGVKEDDGVDGKPVGASPLPNSNVPTVPQSETVMPIPLAPWKYYIGALPEIPLLSSKVVFAVDASDSTAGQVMQRQKEFVLAMVEDHQLPSSVIMWGSGVEPPQSVGQIGWSRQREPEVIFDNDIDAITEELKSCNMWYLLTDGEVDSPVNFARKALEVGMANTPVVFLITAANLTSKIDISVGLPVFASAPDAAIVVKNAASGEIYVIAAKGAFEVLAAGRKINLTNLNWESLPLFPTESAFKTALNDINIVDIAHRTTAGAVFLDRAWHEKHQCLVRINLLLEQMAPQSIPQNELLDLLEDETFKALALLCKTLGLLQTLRDWLLVRNEQPRDMGDNSQSAEPGALRANLEDSPLFPHISRCLGALGALENTGYDVGILEWSSHRDMPAAEAVSSSDVDQEPEVVDQKPEVLNSDNDTKTHRSTSATDAQYVYNRRATRSSTFCALVMQQINLALISIGC